MLSDLSLDVIKRKVHLIGFLASAFGSVALGIPYRLGHAQLAMNCEAYSRRDMGFSAVCVGYMLCRKFGVDVKNFAIDRIPEELAGKSPKEIRAELSKTRSAMSEIGSRVSEEIYRRRADRSKDQER